jgi:hypothetical protein
VAERDPLEDLAAYPTPEEAALASYSAAADARVISSERLSDNKVEVTLEVGPSYRMYSDCWRGSDGLWREVADHN